MDEQIVNFLGLDKRTFKKWKIEKENLYNFLLTVFKDEKEIKSFSYYYSSIELGKVKYTKKYIEALSTILSVKEITVYRWRKKEKFKLLFSLLEEKFKDEEDIKDFINSGKLREKSNIDFFIKTSSFFTKIQIIENQKNNFDKYIMLNYYYTILKSFQNNSKKDILFSLLYEEKRISFSDSLFEFENLNKITDFIFHHKNNFHDLNKIPLKIITGDIIKRSHELKMNELNYIIVYYLFVTYNLYFEIKSSNHHDKINSFGFYCEKIINDLHIDLTKIDSYTKKVLNILLNLENIHLYFIDKYDPLAEKNFIIDKKIKKAKSLTF